MATIKVLLVEDEIDHIELARRSCDQSEIALTTVPSLADAHRALDGESFDLIVADLLLPDGTGDELLLLASDGLPLPVVLMTGHGDEQAAVAALKAGALDYVVKTPASIAELPRIVERALRERRLLVERHQAEQALAQRERLFRAMIERSSDAIAIVDQAGRIRYTSPSTGRLTGYHLEGFLARPVDAFTLIHPHDRERVRHQLLSLIHRPGETETAEFRYRHADGSWRWLEATGSNWLDDSAIQGVIVNYRDITERKHVELRLQHRILHDPLTGLPNRLLLSDRLLQAIRRSQRNPDYRFAVLFLDLDHFKFVNDSFGHPVGDRLLITIASRLQHCLRSVDTCARHGGDEFVVLLDDIDKETDAIQIAGRVLQQVRQPIECEGHVLHISASVGIVFNATEYRDPVEILRDADIAMYQAKAGGKSRYTVFHPGMREAAQARLKLEMELRQAIERREFKVFYQPIIAMASGQLMGFEALVRWQHPERGILSPAAFLAVAEESGLSEAIGWQVLEQVCQQLVEWRQTLPNTDRLSVSVNLSARQFMLPDLYPRIIALLTQYRLPPSCLKLEITENALMEQSRIASAVLTRLRESGIQIVIDDFGVGYSSLSYLVQLPIDMIKIDRNFILQIDQTEHSHAVVNTIVNLAMSLNLEVVAEGLETPSHLERMRLVGCHYGQGYLIGHPLPSSDVTRWLTSR